jgi:dephospho-CoA kinase
MHIQYFIHDLRYPNEANWIKRNNGKIIYIDVQPEIAFKRIKLRNDPKDGELSWEEFLKYKEHPTEQFGNIIRSQSDVIIDNNEDGIDKFYAKLDLLTKDVQ